MKKTATKKLVLCRETVAHLERRDLEQAQGGSIISSDNLDCTYTRLGFETSCWC